MVILTSFPPPTEGICVEQPNTAAHVGSTHFGTGTLYIAESRLSWVGSGGRGFSLEYPAISLHAVSRDRSAHPDECLYMMVDADLQETSAELVAGAATGPVVDNVHQIEDDGDDQEESKITEIRFVPEDRGVLDAMFHAMSACQALHPDPPQDDEDENDTDEDDEGDEYEEEGEIEELITGMNGTTTDEHINDPSSGNNGVADADMDTSQFEDAEPDH